MIRNVRIESIAPDLSTTISSLFRVSLRIQWMPKNARSEASLRYTNGMPTLTLKIRFAVILSASCLFAAGCGLQATPSPALDDPVASTAIPTDEPNARVNDQESGVGHAQVIVSESNVLPNEEPEGHADFEADLATNRPRQQPHGGYVTSAACLECHPNEHDSWSHSYHRTMTQLVDDETVAGGFDGRTEEVLGWQHTPEKRGDDYVCKLKQTDGSDASFDFKLVMSTGSHHMQKFWYHTGKSRKMGMSPLVYLIEADKWLPENAAFLSPPEHGLRLREGDWNKGCNQCHATGAHPRISSQDEMDTLVAEFGISCESCHGPGEEHVIAKTAETIVNPRKLTSTQSAQVCGQCHGAWIRTAQSPGKSWSQTGNAYRPGNDLFARRYYPHGAGDKHWHAKLKAEESFWGDGENRVAGREMNGLLASPCHAHELEDQRRMSCISCHDLHSDSDDKVTWANDQMGAGMYGNEACLQCHESYREDISAHTHHAADSSGSLCYNCHMPYTSYGLLKAVRTHTIVSPSAQVSLETGKPNACNQCHLDQTLEWAANGLTSMYGHPELDLPSDHRNVAASIMWSVKGDAAQRALMAWSMGWEDAREVSGEDWTPFYLVDLMFDDYAAIRYIAYRSLKRIQGFEAIQYDHLHPEAERERIMDEVLAIWNEKTQARPTNRQLLYDASGQIMYPTFQSLRLLRDNRPIRLTE